MFMFNSSGLRGHDKKVFIDRPNKDLRKFTFDMRVRKLWNNLPEHVVNAADVKKFEHELDKHWQCQEQMFDNFKAEIQ